MELEGAAIIFPTDLAFLKVDKLSTLQLRNININGDSVWWMCLTRSKFGQQGIGLLVAVNTRGTCFVWAV